jgi:hypothetical protein
VRLVVTTTLLPSLLTSTALALTMPVEAGHKGEQRVSGRKGMQDVCWREGRARDHTSSQRCATDCCPAASDTRQAIRTVQVPVCCSSPGPAAAQLPWSALLYLLLLSPPGPCQHLASEQLLRCHLALS